MRLLYRLQLWLVSALQPLQHAGRGGGGGTWFCIQKRVAPLLIPKWLSNWGYPETGGFCMGVLSSSIYTLLESKNRPFRGLPHFDPGTPKLPMAIRRRAMAGKLGETCLWICSTPSGRNLPFPLAVRFRFRREKAATFPRSLKNYCSLQLAESRQADHGESLLSPGLRARRRPVTRSR